MKYILHCDIAKNITTPSTGFKIESEDIVENTFFLVWNPKTGKTNFRHKSEKEAIDESRRLAKIHKGEEFIVLMAVKRSISADILTESFVTPYQDDIPF